MTDHNSKLMNKEELGKYIEKDFLPSLLSKLPIMSKHDDDTCPHLVRANLLEAENARLKSTEAERAHEYLTKKGWLPESAQDLSELSPDKVELIVGNKPAFLKAIK